MIRNAPEMSFPRIVYRELFAEAGHWLFVK